MGQLKSLDIFYLFIFSGFGTEWIARHDIPIGERARQDALKDFSNRVLNLKCQNPTISLHSESMRVCPNELTYR